MAILLDSAVVESSRLKTLGDLGNPSSHAAPFRPGSHKTESFEGSVWVTPACTREMFTRTADSAAGRARLSSLFLPRPPGAAVRVRARPPRRVLSSAPGAVREEAAAPARGWRSGGGPRRQGGSGGCALPGLPAGASQNPGGALQSWPGGPGVPRARSGARHDRDARLAEALPPRGRSNLVRDTGLLTRQHPSWPLPPEVRLSESWCGTQRQVDTAVGGGVDPDGAQNLEQCVGAGGDREKAGKRKASRGPQPRLHAGMLAANPASPYLASGFGENRLGN